MRRREYGKQGAIGLTQPSHTLSFRISPTLASALETERVRLSNEIGVDLAVSEMVRHAIERYLKVQITPWPIPLSEKEKKIKRLEAEIGRLRNSNSTDVTTPSFYIRLSPNQSASRKEGRSADTVEAH